MRGRRRRRLAASLLAAILVSAMAAQARAYPRPGSTTLVSRSSAGTRADDRGAWADSPVISANHRFVAFSSVADNLVPGDVNGTSDVFRRDLETGKTALISIGWDGGPGRGSCGGDLGSWAPSISATGRYVAFTSCAWNLVPVDANLTTRDVFIRDMKRQTTSLVSVSTKGVQDAFGASSGFRALSPNGRYVVFLGSQDVALPAVVTGSQLYRRDLERGTTTLVSVSNTGQPANATSGTCGTRGTGVDAGVSANGRYVVFASGATNLLSDVALGTLPDPRSALDLLNTRLGGTSHIYVRDLKRKRTAIADVNDGGAPATPPAQPALCNPSRDVSISNTGRFVAFVSSAPNLVPDAGHLSPDTETDAFVHDMRTGRTERVDVSSAGNGARDYTTGLGGASQEPAISANGRFVSFGSGGCGLAAGASNFVFNVFTHDRLTGATMITSASPAGQPGNGFSDAPDTVDGRYVVFESKATDLVPHARSSQAAPFDFFLRDLGPTLGSGATGRALVVSAAHATRDRPLEALPTEAGLAGATMAWRPESRDVFIRTDVPGMSSVQGVAGNGDGGVLYGVDFAVDGVHYEVRVQRVLGPSYDAAGGASFGLFRRGPNGSVQVATLSGGYGTTGRTIVLAVPGWDIGIRRGSVIHAIHAFSASGTFATGPVRIFDQVFIPAGIRL